MKSDFNPWDKVRYAQDYLDQRELVVGIPYPFQDTYTIKEQLTAIAYLADWEKSENKDRLLNPWSIERIED